MNPEILLACDQVVTAAVNGIGEGILVTLIVGWSLRALGQTNAATRHMVWFGTLLVLLGLIPAELWRQHLGATRGTLINRATTESNQPSAAEPGAAVDLTVSSPARAEQIALERSAPSASPTATVSGVKEGLAPLVEAQEPSTTVSNAPFDPLFNPRLWQLELETALPRGAGAVLVALWLAVAGTRLLVLAFRLNALRKLKQSSLPANGTLEQLFCRMRTKLRVTRNAQLRVSPAHHSAVVLGFRHPVILFPLEESQLHDPEAAEHVLEHELAHVRRRDDWVNLVQHLVQAALFFHPVVWWIGKRLALEREIACDDFVLEQGRRPQAYALLLVNLAGLRNGPPVLAPGVTTGKRQLQQRIGMILNARRNTSPRLAKAKLGFISAATGLTALLVLYAGPKLVLAQNATTAATAAERASTSLAATAAADAQPQAQANALPAPVVAVELAQSDPPVSVPRAVDAGPKFKPGQPPEQDESAPARSPREPRKPRPAAAPRPPRPDDMAGPGSNIEERLDRLERMVKTLMAQQNGHAHPGDVREGGPDQFKGFPFSKQGEFRAEVQREAARAAELDKRALKQAERAMKLEEKLREKGPLPDDLQMQLQALRQQRDVLHREMEKLQSQIERIARERERIAEEKDRRGGDDEDGPKEPKRK